MNIKKILLTISVLTTLTINASDTNNTKVNATLINKVSNNTQELITTTKEKIKSLTVEDIKNGATSTWKKTKEVSSDTWNKTKSTVKDLSETNTSKSIIKGSSEYISKFKNYLTSDTNSTTLKKVKEISKNIKTYSKEKYKEITND